MMKLRGKKHFFRCCDLTALECYQNCMQYSVTTCSYCMRETVCLSVTIISITNAGTQTIVQLILIINDRCEK